MAEDAQHRVQTAVTNMIDDVDKSFLRKMQRAMHTCAAKCCEDERAGLDDVHRCVENCAQPLHKAQSFVQTEMQQFQERLQRCVMECQDKIRDKVGSDTTENQALQYKAEFESCAIRCVDNHMDRIPQYTKKIKDVLKREYYQY